MSEKQPLCPDCQRRGYCQFEKRANEIAASVPQGAGIKEALRAHQVIAQAREKAREKICPHVNRIDPPYPGKNQL